MSNRHSTTNTYGRLRRESEQRRMIAARDAGLRLTASLRALDGMRVSGMGFR